MQKKREEKGGGRGLSLSVSFHFPVHRPTIKARSRYVGGGNRVSPLFKLLHFPPPPVARWKEGKWTNREVKIGNGKGGGSKSSFRFVRNSPLSGRIGKGWRSNDPPPSNRRRSSSTVESWESNDERNIHGGRPAKLQKVRIRSLLGGGRYFDYKWIEKLNICLGTAFRNSMW